MERLVEVLFFASLFREEGHDLTFNLIYPGVLDPRYATPERVHGWEPWHVVDFETLDEFTSGNAAKYALLARGDGEYLVVHCVADKLLITGVGHMQNLRWYRDKVLTVRVVGAGALRFFYGSREIVSCAGGQSEPLVSWPFASPQPALGDIVEAMGNMTDVVQNKYALASGALNMLSSELIRRRHGGIIAIVNQDDAASMPAFGAAMLKAPLKFGQMVARHWEASMVEGGRENPGEDDIVEAQDAAAECDRALSLIGRMSTVDGAVLATPALAIVGFRAKLPAAHRTPPVMRVHADERLEEFDLNLKGTRHRSAACFVEETPHRVALIASADGPAAAMFQDAQGHVVYHPVRDSYDDFAL
ncbi:putative sensor domain DACNV-containing protein [Sorangium sp. So ce295]|uniref:putative sensor domain DACNV-containing protein n=1 Tax=Sorangium sp. So ce295 TaxID=3133295 RepID=UPI003F63C165